MRLLLFIFLIQISTVWAKTNPLIRCLAKEEASFHAKKIQNAYSVLNQSFINEFASNNDISLKPQYIDELCSKNKGMSLYLLELLLTKETEIYDLQSVRENAQLSNYKSGFIQEFQKQVPHLLIAFIGNIKIELDDPYCINKVIPEIGFFEERMKYLEEEISIHEVFNDKNKIKRIFTKLNNFEALKKSCLDLKKKQKKSK